MGRSYAWSPPRVMNVLVAVISPRGEVPIDYTAEERDLYQWISTPQFEVASGLADFLLFSACNFLSSRQRLYCSALAGSGSS